jgi:hypothetical protein
MNQDGKGFTGISHALKPTEFTVPWSTFTPPVTSFAGTWQTIMMMNGKKSIPLTLVQKGDQVTGLYPGNGKIEGTVSGRVLRFKWESDSGTGSGRFVMDEKDHAFSGTFNRGDNPDDVDATWSGTRPAGPEGPTLPGEEPLPIPNKRIEGAPGPPGKMSEAELEKKEAEYEAAQKNAPATFAGAWRGKWGETFMELVLQQTGNQVTGQLRTNFLGVIREGAVVGNTLRFTLMRPGKTLFNGRLAPDEYLGTGELVMDEGGKSFTGHILGAGTSGTLIGR